VRRFVTRDSNIVAKHESSRRRENAHHADKKCRSSLIVLDLPRRHHPSSRHRVRSLLSTYHSTLVMIPYSPKLNKLHSYDSAASRTAADLQIYPWCKILDLSSLSHTGNSNSSLDMELPELPPNNFKPLTISYYYSDSQILRYCSCTFALPKVDPKS
jgi:hypothetical protein